MTALARPQPRASHTQESSEEVSVRTFPQERHNIPLRAPGENGFVQALRELRLSTSGRFQSQKANTVGRQQTQ